MKRLLALLALVAGCFNPVHSNAVDDLGPEANGVRPGPTHRPGQPCTTCHSGPGPGSPEFVMAGTVYTKRNELVAQPGVTVIMTDRKGSTKTAVTNEVGNFYLESSQWTPDYPVQIELRSGSFVKPMKTLIGRNGSCNYCHAGSGDGSHSPAVFLKDIGE